jgi:uncharacterized membrane protein AbrB (regulator of aidB expression)
MPGESMAMAVLAERCGMAEMTIVAQGLQIGVPLVVAFHLFRVVIVNIGTQYIYLLCAWVARRMRRAPES